MTFPLSRSQMSARQYRQVKDSGLFELPSSLPSLDAEEGCFEKTGCSLAGGLSFEASPLKDRSARYSCS